MSNAADTAPIPPAENASTQQTPQQSVPKRSYPGTFDNMFGEAKGVIMLDVMDGFRAEIMKQVTPYFAITHGLMLGSVYFPREVGSSLYNLSVDCFYNKKNFNATLDSTGRVAGRIVWPINKTWSALFNVLTSNMPGQDNASAEVHYKGSDFHVTGKISSGGVYDATYNQFITENLTIGMNAGYNPIRPGLTYGIACRYNQGKAMYGLSLNSLRQTEMWYLLNASRRTKFVSKLTMDLNSRMSELQLGCMYMFKSGRMHMTVTSSGHLQSYIEEFISPTMMLNLSVDHSIPGMATRIGFGTKLMIG